MPLSFLTSLSCSSFYLEQQKEILIAWCLMFSQSCMTAGSTFRLHCLMLLLLLPLFYPTPPFPLIGSRELLWFRVSLSRFPAFPFFQAWSCRAFAPLDSLHCCYSSLASGMSVRGGRERKEGPKRNIKDHRMVGRGRW